MPAAIIGAVATVGGAAIASSGAKSAANTTAAAADNASAVQQQIYNQNRSMLSPYVQQGLAASNQINALLGIPTQQQGMQGLPTQQPNALAAYLSGYSQNPYGGLYPASSAYNPGLFGLDGNIDPYMNPLGDQGQYIGASTTTPDPTTAAQDAFDTFRNSTGYQFRLNQGMDALNSGYAGAGLLQSGAGAKAAINYGQNTASQEFANYLNALGNQQGVGLTAGSSLAGVGTNYANTLGNIQMNSAANQANAGLIGTSALANGISGLGAQLGTILSQPKTNSVQSDINSTIASNRSIF